MGLCLFSSSATAKPGDLDLAFAHGGKTTIDFGGSDEAWGMVAQPDGKIVLGGDTSAGASPHNCAIARQNPDGSADSAFGTGGKTTVDFGGDDFCFALALQADGKIIVAGQTAGASGVAQFALARLNPDGSLDGSFGVGGKSIITFGGNGGGASAVLVQSDGRIIVTGNTSTATTQTDFTAVRLSSNGTVDPSFGTGGHTIVDFGADDHARGAVLQPDGRIVLAGDSTAGTGGHNFAAARLNPDGSVDSSFGAGGKVVIDAGGDDGASAALAQPDGKVVLVGDLAAGSDFAVVRLTSNGSRDASFGTAGKTTVDFGGQEVGRAAALQPDGAIIIAGGTASAGGEHFAIARLSSNGTLDGSFGAGGKTTVDFGGTDVAHAAAVQSDGKILVAGTGGGSHFAIARLSGGGSGGALGPLPPANAPHCRGSVLALVRGGWRCVRVSGVDDRLLPGVADLPGYRSAGGGPSAARSAVGDSVPRALRRAATHGAAFRARKRRLSMGVFTFSSSGRAASALRSLARGRQRINFARRLGGLMRVRSSRRSTDVAIAFQVGRAIGAVRLRASGRLAGASKMTASYASALAARLRRVLALSAWQRTLDGIGPDGSFTPRLALQAFAIAYGSLPGARRPIGPTGAPADRTGAIGMVAQVWNRLSGPQRRAIERDLSAPYDASSPRAARAAALALTPSPSYTAMAEGLRDEYGKVLPARPTVKAFTVSGPLNQDAYMDAKPINASGGWGSGSPAYCQIRVSPSVRARGPVFLRFTMAHEVFHCYQFVLDPEWKGIPLWIREGMADWAAFKIDPVPLSVLRHPTDEDTLESYFETPTKPLFAREYDAVGLWGRADEVGGSLWGKIPNLLRSGSADAYALAGGTSAPFVDTWASSAWRLGSLGASWIQTDPYSLAQDDPTVPAEAVTDGGQLHSEPYTFREYTAVPDPQNPLVNVIASAGRLRAGTGGADLGPVTNEWFCFGKCECPPDEEPSAEIPAHRSVESLYLALTGGASVGDGRVEYHSMDEYCQPKSKGGGGGGGRGGGIQIRRLSTTGGNDLQLIGTITSGQCAFSGGSFTGRGRGGGWKMTLRVAAGRPGTYLIPYGSGGTFVTVSGPGGTYSTKNAPPHGPPSVGGILIKSFRVKKKIRYRISVGFSPVFGSGGGVALSPGPGGLVC